jgi:hypothetical protein
MTLSTSLGCGLLRPWRGMVVKPTCAVTQQEVPSISPWSGATCVLQATLVNDAAFAAQPWLGGWLYVPSFRLTKRHLLL